MSSVDWDFVGDVTEEVMDNDETPLSVRIVAVLIIIGIALAFTQCEGAKHDHLPQTNRAAVGGVP